MIIRFSGGLGNQLFQYALYETAKDKGIKVLADLSSLKINKVHNGYELKKVFNIKIEQCAKSKFCNKYISMLVSKLGLSNYFFYTNLIEEQKFKFINNLISEQNKNKYLSGYWQSEQYFLNTKKELLQKLVFPDLNGMNKKIYIDMQKSTSVSIHVRRGDYISKHNCNIYVNLSDGNYYQNAINYINSIYKDVKYYVFSDDIIWCRDNLPLNNNSVYIDWNNGFNSYIDMQLMSNCRHNIIANSSFSWWAAWLNKTENKIVIAPEHWFTEESLLDYSKIVPESWLRM